MPDYDAEAIVDHAVMIGLVNAEQAFQAKVDADDGSAESVLRSMLRKNMLTSWQVERLQKGDLNSFIYGGCRAMFHLAEGTFARVYRGERMDDRAPVAIKVLRQRFTTDPAAVASFRKEAESGMTLRHPNIVQILDFGEHDKKQFMIMEYVEGSNLRDLLKIRMFLDAKAALPLMIGLAKGLKYSFDHGVTHRDLKATNVLVGSNGVAKLVDFGLATIQGDDKKGAAVNPRTVDYATLERTCGSPKGDTRSDIFFLGCVFYQMLCGQPAMAETEAKNPLEKMLKRGINSIKPISESPRAPDAPLSAIIERMMKVDLKLRYQTIDDVIRDLEAYGRGESGGPAEVGSDEPSLEEMLFAHRRQDDEPARPQPTASAVLGAPAKQLLCVEAQGEVQDVFRKTFSKMGYRVLLMGDAERAAERYREEPPDAVIFDIDGFKEEGLDAFLDMHREATEERYAFAALVLLGPRQAALRGRLPVDEKIVILDKPLKMKEVQAALARLVPIG